MELKVKREADELFADLLDIVDRIRREYGVDEAGQFLTRLHSRVGELLDKVAGW